MIFFFFFFFFEKFREKGNVTKTNQILEIFTELLNPSEFSLDGSRVSRNELKYLQQVCELTFISFFFHITDCNYPTGPNIPNQGS